MKTIIYHNPRCSKSRQTLALLEENGIDFEVIHYLENPPSEQLLAELLVKLGCTANELMRKKEALYQELSDHEKNSLATLVQYPHLMERPIVVTDESAAIGRPPEKVLALFIPHEE